MMKAFMVKMKAGIFIDAVDYSNVTRDVLVVIDTDGISNEHYVIGKVAGAASAKIQTPHMDKIEIVGVHSLPCDDVVIM